MAGSTALSAGLLQHTALLDHTSAMLSEGTAHCSPLHLLQVSDKTLVVLAVVPSTLDGLVSGKNIGGLRAVPSA